MENKKLEKIAKKIKIDILNMAFNAQSAHTGGSLSCAEILTVLYFDVMKVFPKDPNNPLRDRLIFSKAHDAKALYAVLSEKGFFPKSKFLEYEKSGGFLPGHSSKNVYGVEFSGGSLGHGLPIAAGVAYAGKLDNKKFRVFAVLSDGECDEGSTWEAVLFAGHHKLSNLTAVIDYNKLQAYGFTKDVLDLEPFSQKFKSFNWEVIEVNGHSFVQLKKAFKKAHKKPLAIIAHTIKGHDGVEKYINTVASQYRPPTEEETKIAIKKLK
jgi:transketolase